jgi:chemotaxis signal transduction protein
MPVQLGGTWIALPAAQIQEVLGPRAWVPLPDAPAHVPGVIPWRGRAIAVLDLGALLGVAPGLRRGEQRQRTVVAQVEDTAFAIPADTAREVSFAEIEPAHAIQLGLADGQVQVTGVVMPVLDLARAIASVTAG